MQLCFHGQPKAEILKTPPADLMDRVQGDWAKACELYEQGIFQQIWMAGAGVIAICEADSQEHLQALVAELPLAQAGYIDIQIYELKPYRGFGPKSTLS